MIIIIKNGFYVPPGVNIGAFDANINKELIKKAVTNTETALVLLKAFLIGGAICAVTQAVIDKTQLTPGRILVILVTLGVALTAAGVYEPFVRFAGAGATVPLTGFGYTMANGVKRAVESDGLLGVLTGPLTASAGGITAAVLCGVLASILARPGEK